MSLELCIISDKEYKVIEELYNTAFPSEERAPFSKLVRKANQNKAEFLIAKDDETLIGMAYMVCDEKCAYLFYLAIMENLRGKGYGTQLLSELKTRYHDKKLFLARERLDEECDNIDQRIRRHNFYLSNGFKDQSHHIQEVSMTYDIMYFGEPVIDKEYNSLMSKWTGAVLRRILKIKMVD